MTISHGASTMNSSLLIMASVLIVIAVGLAVVLVVEVALGCFYYTSYKWQQYALTDREWHELQHHYQQLPKDRETY